MTDPPLTVAQKCWDFYQAMLDADKVEILGMELVSVRSLSKSSGLSTWTVYDRLDKLMSAGIVQKIEMSYRVFYLPVSTAYSRQDVIDKILKVEECSTTSTDQSDSEEL